MHGNDEWDSVVLARENSAPVTVPGVAMHDLRVDTSDVEIDTALDCAKWGTKRLRTIPVSRIQLKTVHFQTARGVVLIAETANFHSHELR